MPNTPTSAIDYPEILESAERLLETSSEGIVAMWICVARDRGGLAERINANRGRLPIIAAVVRDSAFDEANAVLQDLLALMEQSRDDIVAAASQPPTALAKRLCIIVLSRRELAMPSIGSPITLPKWFPFEGGRLSAALLVDSTWMIDGPLAAPSVQVPNLAGLLVEVERTLLRRIVVMREANHRNVGPLIQIIRRDGDGSVVEMLTKFRQNLDLVTSPEHYRPSVRDGHTLGARLWAQFIATGCDSRGAIGQTLANAIGLTNDHCERWPVSLFSVLARPSNRDEPKTTRCGRELVTVFGVSCQLLTASAHSDAYPRFPLSLLRSVSLDLRGFLNAVSALLPASK